MSDKVLFCDRLSKQYHDATVQVEVLSDITFTVARGEMIAIAGSSGSGKSTLLHLLGGLDQPTTGNVYISGHAIAAQSEKSRSNLRNHYLGFIYQFHHLLPEFTALENVCMPFFIRGQSKKYSELKAKSVLDSVGLSDRMHHRPSELSGGERQRVAIARALVTEPSCILADEPTGNLDPRNAAIVLDLFVELQKKRGTAVVLVTHDMTIAKRAERILVLERGHLVPDG